MSLQVSEIKLGIQVYTSAYLLAVSFLPAGLLVMGGAGPHGTMAFFFLVLLCCVVQGILRWQLYAFDETPGKSPQSRKLDVLGDAVFCFSAAGAIMVIAVADAIGSPDYVVTASPYTFVLFLRLLDRVARRFARCLGIAGDEE
jgi:hypothetical protein